MLIISHRGYWLKAEEKNRPIAFERSFSLGFGTETDIRDYAGELVVAHDIATTDAVTFDNFLEIYNKYDKSLPLALNIKADGLQDKLIVALNKYNITNYFVFDMSVPEAVVYHRKNITIYTRHSEYETAPSLYKESAGVWLDGFIHNWFSLEDIEVHLNAGKKVCIVSPDLHKREHKSFWSKLKGSNIVNSHSLMLCTDYPEEARRYFYGK